MLFENLEIGNNIKFYRVLNDLTYEELAEFVGRSDRGVSRIEKGKSMPPLDVVMRMSKLFNVPMNELFFEKGNEPEKRIAYMTK